jgi:glycosyltransferase involved in cell wall biosynthesis
MTADDGKDNPLGFKKMELTVIICTLNPKRHNFLRVLEALRNQTLDMQEWALLVIDNASSEPLQDCWDFSWHPHARVVRENQPGVAAARRRAIIETTTDLIVYVDDDNVLAENYLFEAAKIKHEWKMLGIWGSGRILPEFEVEPRDDFIEFLPSLALREVNGARWTNTYPSASLLPEITPWGAGQCVRTEVARAYYRAEDLSTIQMSSPALFAQLRGRTTEDVEICLFACSVGWGIGIFPHLKVTHLITRERLTEEYLLKIREFTGASNVLVEYKWHGIVPRNPYSLRGMMHFVWHTLVTRGFRRRMYFGSVRARLRARSIISASRTNTRRGKD